MKGSFVKLVPLSKLSKFTPFYNQPKGPVKQQSEGPFWNIRMSVDADDEDLTLKTLWRKEEGGTERRRPPRPKAANRDRSLTYLILDISFMRTWFLKTKFCTAKNRKKMQQTSFFPVFKHINDLEKVWKQNCVRLAIGILRWKNTRFRKSPNFLHFEGSPCGPRKHNNTLMASLPWGSSSWWTPGRKSSLSGSGGQAAVDGNGGDREGGTDYEDSLMWRFENLSASKCLLWVNILFRCKESPWEQFRLTVQKYENYRIWGYEYIYWVLRI